jgi:hypothetical protein
MAKTEESPQVRGGLARAESLSPEERREIAQKAALARWDVQVPQATHEGDFDLGNTKVSAAVLPNGKRLLTQGTFLRTIGRSRSPKGGTGVLSTADGTPFFLQAEALKPFITDELRMSTTPIFFRDGSGKKGVGYDAELLPMVADVYLQLRDAYQEAGKPVPRQYKHIVQQCDLITRGLARVGIVALVDEATGYQDVRDRQALQEILDKYLRKNFAAWAKKFPDEFYQEIFRLRGWKWKGMKINRPQCVAQYTKNIVYARLTKGMLQELERRNPMLPSGRREGPHTGLLTADVGDPALAQHLYGVIGLMRVCEDRDWDGFMKLLNRAYPKKDDLPLFKDLED